MVSYPESIVKHSMGTFGNATKSHDNFRCFDENGAWLSLLRGMIWNALRCTSTGSGVVDAVCLYGPSCENGVQESPQTFLNPEIKKIFSAEYG